MTDLVDAMPKLPASPVLAAAPHRIGIVSLVVHNLDAVSRFYEDTIGLKVIERCGGTARLGTGSTILLELVHDPAARRRSPREVGLFHTAFLLPSRADLGAWIAFASEQRIAVHGASDHAVSEAVYLSDPESNGIEIYADRPAGQWPVTQAGYDMPSDPLDIQSVFEAAGGRRWNGFPNSGIVGHVHLQVGAIAPAETFYRDLLGFDITCRYPGGSFFGSGGYHHQLAANIWNSRNASPRQDAVTGLSCFELLARDRSVVDDAAVRLRAASVATTPLEGGFAVQDPWGTRVLLRTA
ncbi:MAG TPA: VOC family protein [Geminicoccus sp.]|jgi:catechol 2,3-dioxygenase|uniref:VOC family protein n=1 Tax=Geminicoccus sp. TaxID=2024832 RepID=UPI002E30467C|nr:VOC family protein [Geminicoccus sp.]HEX2529344.1 VOC family protein [Geminicoccus sp.]